MTTFVLVPGAWMGAWLWRPVAERLRSRGHRVYPLSLTGLGERVHLARPDIDLDTHIADVVNLIEFEDLDQVVLVGHSYAGAVVTGVADRIPARLSALVYCDSGPLADGQSMLDLSAPDLREVVNRQGDGWRLPFPDFPDPSPFTSFAGLDEVAKRLMRRHAVAQPFGTYTQKLRLSRVGPTTSYRTLLVLCEDGQRFMRAAANNPALQAFTSQQWDTRELDTGHYPMLSKPDELTNILAGLG